MTSFDPGALIARRFVIERAVADGGMGTVYRARDNTTGAPVALKVLHQEGGIESERFAREAHILADLTHPNIVAYVAHGASDGLAFLVMAWLDGEDLAQHLARVRPARPPRDAVVTLVAEVAATIAFAHARGVIHRDLKPSNVFLVGGALAAPQVLDFGVARLVDAKKAITRAGVVLGTPGYMAPEQALGTLARGPAVDVFSLGCILYECLAGEAPFHAESGALMMARILFDEPTPLAARAPELPGALAELCMRMLDKEPSRRPSAADVAHALARFEGGTEPRLVGGTEPMPASVRDDHTRR